jgi:quinol monooxygenase YgiN
MPVTVILELHIKSELVDDVIAGLAADLPDTRAYQGNLSVHVVRDQADPSHVTLVERWQERADQETYIAWRQSTGSMERTIAASSAPPTITYYDELQDV